MRTGGRRIAWALTAALALGAGVGARAQDASLEYPVKATYLYKLAPFVEWWPAAAFASPTAPLDICVLGHDPFGPILDRAVAGQQIGERPLAVWRLEAAEAGAGCHVMYVAGSPAQSAAQALEAVRGAPVLTVTDAAQGPSRKGVVHFVLQDNRVRFEIDDQAAAEQGLRVSYKQLSLASAVRRRS